MDTILSEESVVENRRQKTEAIAQATTEVNDGLKQIKELLHPRPRPQRLIPLRSPS